MRRVYVAQLPRESVKPCHSHLLENSVDISYMTSSIAYADSIVVARSYTPRASVTVSYARLEEF